MAVQVAQQPARLAALARAKAVAHPRGPLDVLVTAHVVDQGNKTMVQHREIEAQDLLGARADRSLGLVRQRRIGHDSLLADAHEARPPASTKAPMRRYFW